MEMKESSLKDLNSIPNTPSEYLTISVNTFDGLLAAIPVQCYLIYSGPIRLGSAGFLVSNFSYSNLNDNEKIIWFQSKQKLDFIFFTIEGLDYLGTWIPKGFSNQFPHHKFLYSLKLDLI